MPDRPWDPTRVLHVVTRMNIGGPARHVLALTERLRENGFEPLIVYGTPEPDEGELTPEAEASIRVPSLQRALDPGSDKRALTELTRIVSRYRPAIVHTHMAKAGALGRSAARRAKAPVVVHTFHGHVLEGYFASPTNSAFVVAERRLAKRTDALVAVSGRTRDELLELGIGTPERWHVVPLALDLAPLLESALDRAEARARLDLPADAPLVGIVGRLVPIKNHVAFFQAARLVAERRPDARFVVAGDGELRALLEAEADALGGRVHFTGWVTDLPALYAALDVVALTSLNEGTPVALIEATAAGTPVVATDVGGVSDVVRDGENGFLVASEDSVALAEAMLRLLDDAELARAMGERGRALARERHSASAAADASIALYWELLQRKGITQAARP